MFFIRFAHGNNNTISDSAALKIIVHIDCIQDCLDKYYYNKYKRDNYNIYEKNKLEKIQYCLKKC